ncbi:MAG: MFS transporter [Candidatus Bathyarchaeia archaeon]|jgi:MFS family permease
MVTIKGLRDKAAFIRTAPAIFLVLNTFVWYLLTYFAFNTILSSLNLPSNDEIALFLIYNIGIAVTAIVGSKLFPKARTKGLYAWLFMGTIATFFLIFVSNANLLANSLIAFFFGASIGIGLPSCLSYFANLATIESRGLMGGIIWSLTGFTVGILAVLMNLGQLDTDAVIIILASWRLIGAVVFPIINRCYKPETEKQPVEKSPSYFSIIRDKQVLLYLFPWVMFSIINFAEGPLIELAFGTELYTSIVMFEYVFIGIFAIIGGALSDIVGRKRVVIVGFVMLGIEYAALSAFSGYQAVSYLFLILDGITWGLLFSVFLTVIWGDLGERYGKEKFYTVGGIPFLLSAFLTIIVTPYANTDNINLVTAFSIASFFLFLAVIPLMYAPETLPEKSMKDRDLKSYIEKAQKIVSKETKKQQKKEEQKEENADPEPEAEDNSEAYEEAKKLAEKYY